MTSAVLLVRIETHSSALMGRCYPRRERCGLDTGAGKSRSLRGRTTTMTTVCSKRQLQGQENSYRPRKRTRMLRPPAALLYIPLDQSISFSSWWSSITELSLGI